MNPITPERLAEIEARAEAATEGPWEASMSSPSMQGSNWTLRTTGEPGIRLVVSEYQHGSGNADFIAHARTDVPDLVAAVRERDVEIERLRGEARSVAIDLCVTCGDIVVRDPGGTYWAHYRGPGSRLNRCQITNYGPEATPAHDGVYFRTSDRTES